MSTPLAFTILVALVAVQRLWELAISVRNCRYLLRRGAVEVGRRHYPWMVALHSVVLVAAPAEVWLLRRPAIPWLIAMTLPILILAQVLRLWSMRTLGRRWTTRVIFLPGFPPITSGPYRWLRHPSYAAVILELAALPLVHSAWMTAVVASILNLVLLRVRIRAEAEAMLAAITGEAQLIRKTDPKERA